MTRFRNMSLLALTLAVAVLAVLAWTALVPSTTAEASPELGSARSPALAAAACANPGVFTGTDNTGDFQTALENAIAAAAACAGCCDRQVSYRVTQTTGVQGGITARNDITVEIIASW